LGLNDDSEFNSCEWEDINHFCVARIMILNSIVVSGRILTTFCVARIMILNSIVVSGRILTTYCVARMVKGSETSILPKKLYSY
jgi:hypothetical protein